MHIEFEQIYQNIASNVNRGFDDDEIDWLLNRAVERFVDDRVNPRHQSGGTAFQFDSKTSSDLNSILDDDNILPVDKYSDMVYKILLPGDFRYLVNARPYTLRYCDQGFDTTLVPTTYYYGKIAFPKSDNPSWPYTQVQLLVNGVVLFDVTDYPFASPLTDVAQRFVITDLIRDVLSELGINFFWEKYGSVTSPNTFFIEQGTPISSITLYVDGHLVTGSMGTVVRNLPKPYTLNALGNMSSARWTRNEDAYDLSLTPFYQSLADSPITTFAKGHLKVFGRDTSFIVTQCVVDYVRHPRKINLSLDRSCDLPDHTHKEVCGLAAEIAFLYTQRPDWQQKVSDNTTRI